MKPSDDDVRNAILTLARLYKDSAPEEDTAGIMLLSVPEVLVDGHPIAFMVFCGKGPVEGARRLYDNQNAESVTKVLGEKERVMS